MSSPPHVERRETVGEWSDDHDCHYDSWDDDVCDNDRYDSDVEPDSPVVVDTVNATVSREPVRDVVLPSVAVDAMIRHKQNVEDQAPIVISDDWVDTNFIGEVLGTPKENWAGLDDLTFGLSEVTEGHDEGEETPEREMDVDIPTQIMDVFVSDPEGRVLVPQGEMSPVSEGNDRVITTTPELGVTASLSDVSVTSSLFDFIMQGSSDVPVVTTSESVSVETACVDVHSVVMCHDRLRVDDIVIRTIPVTRSRLAPPRQGSEATVFSQFGKP